MYTPASASPHHRRLVTTTTMMIMDSCLRISVTAWYYCRVVPLSQRSSVTVRSVISGRVITTRAPSVLTEAVDTPPTARAWYTTRRRPRAPYLSHAVFADDCYNL